MARCSVCGSKECCGGDLEQERDQLQARVAELEVALEGACEDALAIPGRLEALHGPYISGGFGEEIAVSVSGMVSDIYHHRSEKVRGGGNTPAQSLAAIEARVLRDEAERTAIIGGSSTKSLRERAERIENGGKV